MVMIISWLLSRQTFIATIFAVIALHCVVHNAKNICCKSEVATVVPYSEQSESGCVYPPFVPEFSLVENEDDPNRRFAIAT